MNKSKRTTYDRDRKHNRSQEEEEASQPNILYLLYVHFLNDFFVKLCCILLMFSPDEEMFTKNVCILHI